MKDAKDVNQKHYRSGYLQRNECMRANFQRLSRFYLSLIAQVLPALKSFIRRIEMILKFTSKTAATIRSFNGHCKILTFERIPRLFRGVMYCL